MKPRYLGVLTPKSIRKLVSAVALQNTTKTTMTVIMV